MQKAWRSLLAVFLMLATLAAMGTKPGYTLFLGVCVPCAGLASLILWMQFNSLHPRNLPLRWAWRLGALFLCLPLLMVLLQSRFSDALPASTMTLAAGTAVLTAGLPLLVIGMQLEIVPFLAWIELRQRHPRGIRVPGVGTLLASSHKQQLVCLHALSALAAVVASLIPHLTRAAGALIVIAYAASLIRLTGVWRGARAFAPAPERRTSR